MILPQYAYKDHLNLSARLGIAQTYTRLGGYHGLVTELAIDYTAWKVIAKSRKIV